MQRYRVCAEKNGGDTAILAYTDSYVLARIIAEHIALTHSDYVSLVVQERLRDQWQAIRTVGGGGAALTITVRINDTLVRYGPA